MLVRLWCARTGGGPVGVESVLVMREEETVDGDGDVGAREEG